MDSMSTDEEDQLQKKLKPNEGKSNEGGRKRGPWSEPEHLLFLLGLKRCGPGQWRNIAREYVVTRTPTQVASHAQKYTLWVEGRIAKKRPSMHDVVTLEGRDLKDLAAQWRAFLVRQGISGPIPPELTPYIGHTVEIPPIFPPTAPAAGDPPRQGYPSPTSSSPLKRKRDDDSGDSQEDSGKVGPIGASASATATATTTTSTMTATATATSVAPHAGTATASASVSQGGLGTASATATVSPPSRSVKHERPPVHVPSPQTPFSAAFPMFAGQGSGNLPYPPPVSPAPAPPRRAPRSTSATPRSQPTTPVTPTPSPLYIPSGLDMLRMGTQSPAPIATDGWAYDPRFLKNLQMYSSLFQGAQAATLGQGIAGSLPIPFPASAKGPLPAFMDLNSIFANAQLRGYGLPPFPFGSGELNPGAAAPPSFPAPPMPDMFGAWQALLQTAAAASPWSAQKAPSAEPSLGTDVSSAPRLSVASLLNAAPPSPVAKTRSTGDEAGRGLRLASEQAAEGTEARFGGDTSHTSAFSSPFRVPTGIPSRTRQSSTASAPPLGSALPPAMSGQMPGPFGGVFWPGAMNFAGGPAVDPYPLRPYPTAAEPKDFLRSAASATPRAGESSPGLRKSGNAPRSATTTTTITTHTDNTPPTARDDAPPAKRQRTDDGTGAPCAHSTSTSSALPATGITLAEEVSTWEAKREHQTTQSTFGKPGASAASEPICLASIQTSLSNTDETAAGASDSTPCESESAAAPAPPGVPHSGEISNSYARPAAAWPGVASHVTDVRALLNMSAPTPMAAAATATATLSPASTQWSSAEGVAPPSTAKQSFAEHTPSKGSPPPAVSVTATATATASAAMSPEQARAAAATLASLASASASATAAAAAVALSQNVAVSASATATAVPGVSATTEPLQLPVGEIALSGVTGVGHGTETVWMPALGVPKSAPGGTNEDMMIGKTEGASANATSMEL